MPELVEINWLELGIPPRPDGGIPLTAGEQWDVNVMLLTFKSAKWLEKRFDSLPCREELQERDKLAASLRSTQANVAELQKRGCAMQDDMDTFQQAKTVTDGIWRSYGGLFSLICAIIVAIGGVFWIAVNVKDLLRG